jgi:rare lipoprotein A (peptidoglycan hydrolase)
MSPAHAGSIDQRLSTARGERRAALARLRTLHAELRDLLTRYARLERRAGRASLRLVDASRAVQEAQTALQQSQRRLDERVRAAYELGPGGIVDALLSSRSFADLATVHDFTARTIGFDARALQAQQAALSDLRTKQTAARRARRALAPQQRALGALLGEIRSKLNQAERLAARTGATVDALEQEKQALREASARESDRNLLSGGATGADQSALLALLGPNGGRTCGTPDGLTDTGTSFAGDASWYGWEFAGQTTASGAVFDPRLFTAANRWLPFGTFLRVRYGDRCAIVLVNDRGPYGNPDRVVDLSMASAWYLGIGVASVRAEILVPTDPLPG